MKELARNAALGLLVSFAASSCALFVNHAETPRERCIGDARADLQIYGDSDQAWEVYQQCLRDEGLI